MGNTYRVRKRAALWGIIVAVLLAGALVVARRHEVLAWLLPRIVATATGYDVTIGETRFGATHGALLHVRVSKGGEPVLEAARIDVWYSLRDLLPGSRHRYGVNAIAIDAPRLTLVRHQDGTYNVALPQPSAPTVEEPQLPNRVPFSLTIRVRNGYGAVRAPYTLDPQARNLAVTGITADATINSNARTHYTISGAFVEATNEPFSVVGTIDIDRGFAMHRVRAAALPMRAIANYFINSRAARVLAGSATNLDLRAYSLDVEPYKDIAYHFGGGLDIAAGSVSITGITKPVEAIGGHVQLVDDALFVRNLAAKFAGVPATINGGLIAFSDPQYHLGIAMRGDLRTLRSAFAFSAAQPVSGPAQFSVVVQGGIASPEVLVRMDSPRIVYDTMPIRAMHANIAYLNSTVVFAPLEAIVGSGAHAVVRGTLSIDDNVHSKVAVHVTGNAADLPYAGEVLGREPMRGDFVLNGLGTDFAGTGMLASTRSPDRMTAIVRLQRGGVLAVAPFWIHTGGGTFDAAYYLDRTHDTSAFWLNARNVKLRAPLHGPDFGALLPQVPPMNGTIGTLAVVGGGASGLRAVVGGSLRLHDMTIANVGLSRVQTTFAGTLADAAADPITASGPWGTLRGRGAVSLHGLAVRGVYHGTLEGLRQFLAGTRASGRIDGTAALAIAPNRITVQAENLQFGHAQLLGLPLRNVRGTLAIENGTVHIYNARAALTSGTIVAAGPYTTGISLIANKLDGAHMRGLGLPLDAGVVSGEGRVAQGAPLPTFDGGFAVANGRAQRYELSGTGLAVLRGDRVRLTHVLGSVDGNYAFADGDVSRLTSGSPAYALHARVPAGDVARTIQMLALPSFHSDGTFNADLNISGAGLAPRIHGPIEVPAGSVNGLPFVDAGAMLTANPSGATAREGRVLVGTTHLTFLAGSHPRISGLHVRSNAADLSDFNNFFDTGDTLDGNGSFRFDGISQHDRISSNGTLSIDGFRYRNLSIGDMRASWSSARSVVSGSLNVNGEAGGLRAHGSIGLAAGRIGPAVLTDANYALALELKDVDLSTWVAALGFPQVPITGHVNANADLHGRFPRLSVSGSTELGEGTIWRLPIDSARLDFASSGDRVHVTSGSLSGAGVSASASGDFGFGVNDPLHLSVYLHSNDVAGLSAQLFDRDLPIAGDFESTITIGGSFAKPTFAAAFDASDATIYGVHVPSIFGSLRLKGSDVELANAGVQFEHGSVALAGTLPLHLQPFGIGPEHAPMNVDIAIDGVDPGIFDTILGNDAKLGGTIDGRIGIAGTAGQPSILGRLGITNGSFVSDLDLTPITAVEGTLEFSRTEASVQAFSAKLGTGTVTGSGSVSFANGTTFDVKTVMKQAQLSSPQFGSGTLDGALALVRTQDTPALFSGNIALSNAAIPFSAFLAAAQGGSDGASAAPIPQLPFALGFDLQLAADRNVRVRGAGLGAGLDIGATGSVHLAGTSDAPTLEGGFKATGGTLTYFDRAFRVTDARVAFDPDAGIIPTLHATGLTRVTSSDGPTDITIDVSGPINGLRVDFSTNPPGFTNDQILAMIAPFGGLIGSVNFTPGLNRSINGVTPYGALSPVPGARAPGATTTGTTVGQEAFNILNAQFSAGLLSPVESVISQGLGFQSVNLTVDYFGNVGVQASRLLGRTVNLIYSTSFGIPIRQTVGIQILGPHYLSAQLTFYLQNGTPTLFRTPVASFTTNQNLAIGEPLEGSSGFAFSLQRLFW